jgi:hypothetical protein
MPQNPVYLTDPSGNLWSLSVNANGQLTYVEVPAGPSPPAPGGYPSLDSIMQLVRVFLNDWQAGVTGTPGEGQITTNSPTLSPQTLPALNSAIRELYRELRNIGAPRLIRDNVQANLPVNGLTGCGVQTFLSFNGYFDGLTLQPSPVLPSDMLFPVELWEQQTGQALPFVRMSQPQFGLPSRNQTFALGEWEWREDQLNFVGTLSPVTIRMRYMAALTQFPINTVFASTFIPVLDCEEVVAYKTAYKIGFAMDGLTPAIADLKQSAIDAMTALKLQNIRRQQTQEFDRSPYASGTTNGNSSGNSSSNSNIL